MSVTILFNIHCYLLIKFAAKVSRSFIHSFIGGKLND